MIFISLGPGWAWILGTLERVQKYLYRASLAHKAGPEHMGVYNVPKMKAYLL
jgi:hypothetical protein